MALSEIGTNAAEYTVSELSGALKRTVEDAYGYVRVRAELGKVTHHSNGHIYLDLKDERACIAGVVWKGSKSKLKIKPEMGLEVIVSGRITTYAPQSKYQLVIETLEPSGIGALMALLEERRKKFAAEGLFDEARKKKLPRLPLTVGVITSPTGAVIRDILHRISDRFPLHVLVWPVRVQGETCAAEVTDAINGFNAAQGVPRPDVLIVARGGGSIEDLWGFNEEVVVRAAAASQIPLISAIGHETDWTLLDHVADLRAPTPTAAAEFAVPVRQDFLVQLSQIGTRQLRALTQQIEKKQQTLRALARALPRLDMLLSFPRQRLDHAGEGLARALLAMNQKKRMTYMRTAQKLSLPVLAQRLDRWRDRLEDFRKRYQRAIIVDLKQQTARLQNSSKLLGSLSYRSVLARGFAVVRDAQGEVVMRQRQALALAKLRIEFADGEVEVARKPA